MKAICGNGYHFIDDGDTVCACERQKASQEMNLTLTIDELRAIQSALNFTLTTDWATLEMTDEAADVWGRVLQQTVDKVTAYLNEIGMQAKGWRTTDDEGEAAALYGTMSAVELRSLRRAFELDRAHATTDAQRRFCDGRLALIAGALDR